MRIANKPADHHPVAQHTFIMRADLLRHPQAGMISHTDDDLDPYQTQVSKGKTRLQKIKKQTPLPIFTPSPLKDILQELDWQPRFIQWGDNLQAIQFPGQNMNEFIPVF